MSSFQKTIKYIAIAFAVFLSITIISGIVSAGSAIFSVISGGVHFTEKETTDFDKTFTGVTGLDIDNSTGRLTIKKGDAFRVEAEGVSKDFSAEIQRDGTLRITDNDRDMNFLWFNFNSYNSPNSRVTIYLPSDFIAEDTKIDTGAGTVTIENLQTERLRISAGAGNITGMNIDADDVKIEGGVGAVKLDNVNFTDADIECGVGNLKLQGIFLGDTKVDCGVGEVELDLIGNEQDYDLDIDSGVGNIRLNGEKVSGEFRTNHNAQNSIRIDGGVGNVKIDFEQGTF